MKTGSIIYNKNHIELREGMPSWFNWIKGLLTATEKVWKVG
jgi:hypothetical protein